MSSEQSLNAFLKVKGPAMTKYFESAMGTTEEHIKNAVSVKTTRTVVEGRSGVRRVFIRDHQILADSPPAWCGYNLGPAAPEIALGALGACIAHMYLAVAGMKQIDMESLEIETTGSLDLRKGGEGFEDEIPGLDNINYTVFLESNASEDVLKELHASVEKVCPIFNLIKYPNNITSKVVVGDKVVSERS